MPQQAVIAHLPEEPAVVTVANKEKRRAKLEKDLGFAINCLEASGEHPEAVADAREIMLRNDGVYWLVQALLELYADAGVTSIGLPKSMLGPHAVHTLVKAIEEANALRLKQEKEASENEAAPEMTPS